MCTRAHPQRTPEEPLKRNSKSRTETLSAETCWYKQVALALQPNMTVTVAVIVTVAVVPKKTPKWR